MSKLEHYLTEARNLQSDIGKIKKIVKSYVKQRDGLRVKMLNDVDRIIDSVSKSVKDEDYEAFKDQVFSWFDDIKDNIQEPDLESAFS